MSIDLERLRTFAESIMNIPEHYRLEMEDSIPHGAEKYRWFIWENPSNDEESIEIMLDLNTGELHSLRMERAEQEATHTAVNVKPSIDEMKAAAERFLAKHAKESDAYRCVNVEEGGRNTYFTYRMEIGGIPLPDTGCDITVNVALEVTRYQSDSEYSDISMPQWPSSIVDAEYVKEDALRHAKMELSIALLSPELYEIESSEAQYRLVYVPTPELHMIDAQTGSNLFDPEHYTMPLCYPIEPKVSNIHKGLSLPDGAKDAYSLLSFCEKLLNIDAGQYSREEAIDDEEAKVFYYLKTDGEAKESKQQSLSADSYMDRKWGDKLRRLEAEIILNLELSTGRLTSMMRKRKEASDETSANYMLSREQCWEKAQQFLSSVFPEYADYLQLEVKEAENEPDEREFFYLPLYVDGIPVHHERITLSVCKLSGHILMYMGSSYALIECLRKGQYHPVIDADQAFKLYKNHVTANLRWFLDELDKLPKYRLIYDVEARNAQRLRFIDARTGELIRDRAMKRK